MHLVECSQTEKHSNQSEESQVLWGKTKQQGTRTSSFPPIMEHTTLSVSFFHTTYSHKLNPQNFIPSVSMFSFLASTHPFVQKKIIICIFLKHLNLASTSLFMQVHNSVSSWSISEKSPTQKREVKTSLLWKLQRPHITQKVHFKILWIKTQTLHDLLWMPICCSPTSSSFWITAGE